MSGGRAHHGGLAAEHAVAARYEAAGGRVLARRWRGSAGEIDLIVAEAGVVVFVEVKSSRRHGRAAERISRAQARRLARAAEEYAAGLPDGALSEMRFDVALVDAAGRIEILRNVWLDDA